MKKQFLPGVDESALWTKSRSRSLIKNDFELSCILIQPTAFNHTGKSINFNQIYLKTRTLDDRQHFCWIFDMKSQNAFISSLKPLNDCHG